MSTALAIVIAAVALACPLHMLWRVRQGRRGCCAPVGRGAAAELRERQQALAERTESLVDESGPHEPAAEQH